ncbi:MAG: enterobactin synthetase component D [Glaciecola sp.]|jgi:4'-phosphopantetheinyl transferase EntD
MVQFLTEPVPIRLSHSEVLAFQCYFDADAFTIEQALTLPIAFPDSLYRTVKKRQAEYFAGRICARYALLKLNAEVTQVLTGVKRQPLWPKNKNGKKLVGSITHSENIALCIVAEHHKISNLGIDIECHMTEKLAKEIENTVINAVEKQRLASVNLAFPEALTLVFSAKETIFKALFDDVGEHFSFEAAELLSLDINSCTAKFALTTTIAAAWPKGRELDIYFQRFSDHLMTYFIQVNV